MPPSEPAINGMRVLDASGNDAKVEATLLSLDGVDESEPVIVVLTVREGAGREWTDTLRYIQVAPEEYDLTVEQ